MGGLGSGRVSPSGGMGRDRRRKSASLVCGSGTPEMPPDLPPAVGAVWERLVEMTAGVAFAQDSEALAELAWLTWRQSRFRDALATEPLDENLNRTSLALGRAMLALLTQFGLSPRSRQILLVPAVEPEERDELDEWQQQYQP